MIETAAAKGQEMTLDDHIKAMAAASKTPQHEVILQCLDYCGVYGTRCLTVEMVEDFWKWKEEQEKK